MASSGVVSGPASRTEWLRLAERVAWVAGASLLLLYAAIRYQGAAGSRRELQRFREARAAPSAPAVPAPANAGQPADLLPVSRPSSLASQESKPDVSLWSPERIRAWRESLKAAAPPPLAVLRIPKIGLEVSVLEGTDEEILNRAVGHIEDTPLPGEPGNCGVAGHRDGFFRGLKDIARGDTLEVETLKSTETYIIEQISIVSPEDVSVLDPTPGSVLTLVTCYPFYFVGSAPQRYIVRAVRNPRT